MWTHEDDIKYATTEAEINSVIDKLEQILAKAQQKKNQIIDDEEIIILNCQDKRITVEKGSKVEVDSWGCFIKSKPQILEIAEFGRPNTKKYNKFKQDMIEKYEDSLYKIR